MHIFTSFKQNDENIPFDRSKSIARSIAQQLVRIANENESDSAYRLADTLHEEILAAINEELEQKQ